MSWGWFALVLGAFWLGAQLRQLENGDHFLQKWWAQRQTRVVMLPATMRVAEGGGMRAFAEIRFVRSLRNASVRIETFKQVRPPHGFEWRRFYWDNVVSGQEFNSGDSKEVKLIEALQKAPQQAVPSALTPSNALLNALSPPPVPIIQPPLPNPEEGYYRIVVTVTGSGVPAVNRHYDFEWRGGRLNILPLTPDASSYGGDTLKVEQGSKTLWTN